MENVIWAKFEDYNPGRASQSSEKCSTCEKSRHSNVIFFFWDRGMYFKGHMIDSFHHQVLSSPYKIKKECCVVDGRRTLQENVGGWAGISAYRGGMVYAQCRYTIYNRRERRGQMAEKIYV